MSLKYTRYVAELQQEFPGFQVKSYLDNWFFRWLWSLGWRMGATTLWNTVFMNPRDIDTNAGYETLRHEAVHLRDQREFHVFFFLSYFLLLPAVLTLRAHWEWRGYYETMVVEFEERGEISDWTIEWICDQFVGANYFFMFPFRGFMMKKLNEARREITAQALDA